MNGQGEPKKDGLMEKEIMASLAHCLQALQRVSVALQMLAGNHSAQPLQEAKEEPNFHSKKNMNEDLANIIDQATAEYDVCPLRLLGVHESYL